MQARDCLASDGWCTFRLPCAEIHRDAPIILCLAVILGKRAKLRKVADSSFCCNREQERVIAMYFHKYMHTSILVPPITHLEAWWPRSRIAQFNMGWMLMKTQRDLTPSWMIRRGGDWGIELHSVTRSMKCTSFPVPRLTPIPNTMQYAWYAWNATKIQS